MTVTGWDVGVFVEMMAFYQNYVVTEWQADLLRIQQHIDRWASIMQVVEIASVILAVAALALLLIRIRVQKGGKH
jgi:hypothetical protein